MHIAKKLLDKSIDISIIKEATGITEEALSKMIKLTTGKKNKEYKNRIF